MSFLEGRTSSSLRLVGILPTSYGDVRPHHMLALYTLCTALASTKLYRRISDSIINLLSRATDYLIPLVYKGLVPDVLVRFGIRLRLRDHLALLASEGVESDQLTKMGIVSELKSMDIAIREDAANEQHYEVPAAFYDLCLGPRKKYSSGLWPSDDTTFEESEVAMLELYCERAGIEDGMKVVDLGCGWGSMTLHLAERYPNCKITAISNSHSQREYILRTAQERGYNVDNINVITCNVSDDKGALDGVKDNDRVMSIEMFEHMKNYSRLLSKIHRFLSPSGRLFVHIFTHKRYAYHFADGWLAENFFTGGTMPSDDLLLYFPEHFACLNHWRVNGRNYERTSNGWLEMLDRSWRGGKLQPVLRDTYGEGREREWYVNWRLFYLSCAELWGYDGGEEWIVSHFLFERRL